jgi:hypothetical protein
VPLVPIHPADASPDPRGGKGPAEPRGRKGPAYKEEPQVRNLPAYKELDNKKGSDVPVSPSAVEGVAGSPGEAARAIEPPTPGSSMLTSLRCLTIGARDGSCYACSPTRFWRSYVSASAVASSTRLRWLNSGCATDISCRIVDANNYGQAEAVPNVPCCPTRCRNRSMLDRTASYDSLASPMASGRPATTHTASISSRTACLSQSIFSSGSAQHSEIT